MKTTISYKKIVVFSSLTSTRELSGSQMVAYKVNDCFCLNFFDDKAA